ncbi:MAG TPA: hypothetical protein VFV48_04510 [Pseudomonadales bacterium]|nr:hypothetical protein [Pseudomonadales bacterium]
MKKNNIDEIMDKISDALEERKNQDRRKADNDDEFDTVLDRRKHRDRRAKEKTTESKNS